MASAPDDVPLALSCARLLSAHALPDDALAIHRRLLEGAEPPPESVLAMADVLLEGRAFEAAIQLVRRALAQRPRDVELERALALVLERSGHLVEAREQAQRVRSLAPHDQEAFRIIGRVSGRLGDTTNCVDAWRHVVALTGHRDLDARTALGIALSHAGRHDDALRQLSDVIVLAETASAHANLGMALLEATAADDALASFGRAIQLDGNDPQARLGAGLALLALARPADAVRALRAATELAPTWETAWYNLALALRADGALPEARRALVRAAGLAPDDAEIQELLEELAAPPSRSKSHESSEISGDLSSFPLPDLIEFLRSGAKTGTVVVAARQGEGRVRLDQGRIASARARNTAPLGAMLVERGLVGRADLDRVLLVQQDRPDQPEKLGSLLLAQGLVQRDALRRAMFEQTLSALEEILSWPEGTFFFQRQRQTTSDLETDPDPISFDAQHVMMELMRIMDERQYRRPAR